MLFHCKRKEIAKLFPFFKSYNTIRSSQRPPSIVRWNCFSFIYGKAAVKSQWLRGYVNGFTWKVKCNWRTELTTDAFCQDTVTWLDPSHACLIMRWQIKVSKSSPISSIKTFGSSPPFSTCIIETDRQLTFHLAPSICNFLASGNEGKSATITRRPDQIIREIYFLKSKPHFYYKS